MRSTIIALALALSAALASTARADTLAAISTGPVLGRSAIRLATNVTLGWGGELAEGHLLAFRVRVGLGWPEASLALMYRAEVARPDVAVVFAGASCGVGVAMHGDYGKGGAAAGAELGLLRPLTEGLDLTLALELSAQFDSDPSLVSPIIPSLAVGLMF